MNKLKQWQEKIDALSLRERGAIFFCTIFVLYFACNIFLMQPLELKERRIKTQLQQKQAEQLALNLQIQDLVVDNNADPDRADREKLQALRSQLKEIESKVRESSQQLIAPENMAAMLEKVLLEVKGLELVDVRGLGAEPVIKTAKPLAEGKDIQQVSTESGLPGELDNAYKHGLRIEFQGDYLSTLQYVRALENLQWDFLWESLEFEVNEYPKSTAAITVFTLSLDKNWIGV